MIEFKGFMINWRNRLFVCFLVFLFFVLLCMLIYFINRIKRG